MQSTLDGKVVSANLFLERVRTVQSFRFFLYEGDRVSKFLSTGISSKVIIRRINILFLAHQIMILFQLGLQSNKVFLGYSFEPFSMD